MAILPVASIPGGARNRIFSRPSLIFLLTLIVLLGLCLIFSWTTRDAMAHLPFLSGRGNIRSLVDTQKTLVDLRPWQTAEALAQLAVTAEEKEHAREAERLADHEVDQAFASALRLASIRAQHLNLTGEALGLSQRVEELQQLVKEDQAVVDRLTPASHSQAGPAQDATQSNAGDDDLEVAKAQLGLDSDQLADTQEELDRASGDDRAQIQSELAAHEALMRKYDSETHGPEQAAVVSATQHSTLASRLTAWSSQRDRYKLIQQATQQTQADIASLTAEHKTLEAMGNASTAAAESDPSGRTSRLANIKERGARSQLLIICNDRIQTEQQLAAVYGKWSAQVLLQHRILLHLILQSLALIAFILICVVLCDALVRRLMANLARDRRQMQTLRSVLQLAIQVIGGLFILLVVFGWPRQMSTILGLTSAGLTIAMQDFILAFFGWFVLMGKNGIRIGDWVEINGVGGEVTEIGLMSTTLLETGDLADRGHPTGRRITFLNNFAIRGKYFNFSTAGQWMWDEITVNLPISDDTEAMVERIRTVTQEETQENARIAEHEWKRGTRDDGLSRFSAAPKVSLRPSGSGIEILVRYVTRASERFGVRNRLYQRVIDLLHKEKHAAGADPASGVRNV
ncbi:MAG: mechanosensitive ion channel [Terracidiphilus sp.]|nr:mechanosensitive ion channel [Terracidiphilus sp.]